MRIIENAVIRIVLLSDDCIFYSAFFQTDDLVRYSLAVSSERENFSMIL